MYGKMPFTTVACDNVSPNTPSVADPRRFISSKNGLSGMLFRLTTISWAVFSGLRSLSREKRSYTMLLFTLV